MNDGKWKKLGGWGKIVGVRKGKILLIIELGGEIMEVRCDD